MHLKLGFVIGCKITTFLQILQYAFYWMVTDVSHFAIILYVTVRCLNVSTQKVKIIYLSSFKS